MTTAQQIRIALVDDQALIRQGMRYILNSQPDMVVVGEAGNGMEAVAVVNDCQPDLVLMDIQMPVQNGIDATRLILAQRPATKIVLLTTFDVQEYVVDGIRAGAVGYLLKDADSADLLAGIRLAHQGSAIYRSTSAAKAMAEVMTDVSLARPESVVPLPEPLTEREIEVLQLMAYGHKNSEIADALFLSAGTVKTHVHRILQKLGVEDRTQAVVYAIRQRIVK